MNRESTDKVSEGIIDAVRLLILTPKETLSFYGLYVNKRDKRIILSTNRIYKVLKNSKKSSYVYIPFIYKGFTIKLMNI